LLLVESISKGSHHHSDVTHLDVFAVISPIPLETWSADLRTDMRL
jgi:hypothetical protein